MAGQDRQQDRQATPGDDITRRDIARFDQFLDSHRDIAEQIRKTPSLIDDSQYLSSHSELNGYLLDHPGVKQEISQRPDTFMRLEDIYDRDTSLRDRDAGGQDRDAGRRDDGVMRRDVARFDQFLDRHRDVAQQLRRTPSLIDDPQYLSSHAELSGYLQDHPGVKEEISQRPDTFMRLEDQYDRDTAQRDRDAGGQDFDARGQDRDRDANRSAANDNGAQDRDRNADSRQDQDRDSSRSHAMNQDRDANRGQDRDNGRRDFDRFLDQHREIGEQVRKNPSLCNDRNFVESHAALQAYFRDNPGVRDRLRQDPNAFMRQGDFNNSDLRDRDANRDANGQDRDDAGRRDAMNNQDRDGDRRDSDRRDFGRFLDQHREIGEQVRKNPSLCNDRDFVQGHPALQAYLQEHPGVHDQLRLDPNAFARQADNRDFNGHDRDGRMADFGGFLGNHSDVQRDLSRDATVVKDPHYVQDHTELNAYLSAHPDVRSDLMANPQDFVHGAQQYKNGSATGIAGHPGVSGSGTGTTGTTGATGTPTGASTNPAATTHVPNPKPNQ